MLTDEPKNLIRQWEKSKREKEMQKVCDEFDAWVKSLDLEDEMEFRFHLYLSGGSILFFICLVAYLHFWVGVPLMP
jgi:hypothetical protein